VTAGHAIARLVVVAVSRALVPKSTIDAFDRDTDTYGVRTPESFLVSDPGRPRVWGALIGFRLLPRFRGSLSLPNVIAASPRPIGFRVRTLDAGDPREILNAVAAG
jgi:hypothetical protein